MTKDDAAKRPRRAFFWVLKNTMNRFAMRVAESGHGPFSVMRHVGRHSGRTYETPLILARVAEGFVAELTYGAEVNWYKNVVAAGQCVVIVTGVEYHVDAIEPYPSDAGRRAFGGAQSLVLTLLRRHEFRLLRVTFGEPTPTEG